MIASRLSRAVRPGPVSTQELARLTFHSFLDHHPSPDFLTSDHLLHHFLLDMLQQAEKRRSRAKSLVLTWVCFLPKSMMALLRSRATLCLSRLTISKAQPTLQLR